jgi:hypothetical protein
VALSTRERRQLAGDIEVTIRPRAIAVRIVALLWTMSTIAVSSAQARNPEIARLIDQLERVTDEGIGFHATAWGAGFIGVDMEPEFRGGVLGAPKPAVSPVVRDLVRIGVAALPDLIDHLSDRRETKLKFGGFMGMWHSDEYDPRRRPAQKYEPGRQVCPAYDPTKERYVSGYTLRVGDLCFVAIGQIVNRNLLAVRYQPSGCLVINSPVETPALAEKVRRDWSGLTAQQHKRSLVRDALAPAFDADPLAAVRLLYYYPDDGEKVVLRLLNRRLVNNSITWHFISERLVLEPDGSHWQNLIDEFGRK